MAIPEETPWADAARIDRDGIAWVCALTDALADRNCVTFAEQASAKYAPGRREQVSIDRRYLGVAGKPTDYLILTTPPR